MAKADPSIEFEISLDANKAEQSGKKAADSLGRLEKALTAGQAKYNALGRAMKDIQKAENVDVGLLAKLAKQQHDVGNQLAQMRTRWVDLKDKVAATGPKVEMNSKLLAGYGKVAAITAVAVAALAAGFLYLGAKIAGSAIDLAKYVISVQDARRAELLHFEALSRVRSVWGLVFEKGQNVQQQIDRVSASSSVSRAQIAGYAESLQKAGVRGQNFADTLEAMSLAATTGSEAQVEAIAALARTTVYFGGSTKQVLNDAKARWKDISDRAAMGFGVQLLKLRESAGSLFRSVNIEPFLKAMKRLTELLSLQSQTGQALQQVFGDLFTAIFGQSGQAADKIEVWVKKSVIWLQELTLEILGLIRQAGGIGPAFHQILGRISGAIGDLFINKIAPAIGRVVAAAIKAAIFGTTDVSAQVKVQAAKPREERSWWSFLSSTNVGGGSSAAVAAAMPQGFRLGENLMKGAAHGVKAATPEAVAAIGESADAMKAKFGQSFDMHSPSRFMARQAINIPLGAAVGVRQGIPAFRAAATDMYQAFPPQPAILPPSPDDIGRVTSQITNNRHGGQVTIQQLTVQAPGPDARQMAESVREALARELEGMGIEMGAGYG